MYLAGFCLLLLTWPEEQEDNEKNVINLSKTDLSLYPFYVTLIGGPILCLTGILHTMLTGTRSSISGAISTVLSTIYFVCAGHVAYTSGQTVSKVINDPYTAESDPVSLSPLLMLIGVVAEALCWMSVKIATVTRHKFCQTEESNDNKWRLNCDKPSYQPFSPGLARKLSVLFIALSASGWLILASRINLNGHEEGYEVSCFYIGPFLFLIALLHAAGCPERMGVLTYVLSMLYVTLMGAGLISYGEAICLYRYHDETHTDCCVKLAGTTISLVFWTHVLVLCQFYCIAHHKESKESKEWGKAVPEQTNKR